MKNRLPHNQSGTAAALQRDACRSWRFAAWLMARLIAIAMIFGGALTSLPAVGADAPILLITQPAEQETMHDNTGAVPVVMKLQGAEITAARHLRVLLDGKLYTEKIHTLSFTLEHVDRGMHSLRVELIDEANAIVATSPTHTFYLWQASRLLPTPSR